MTGKDDCNVLLNATLPFAEKMLLHHGEFFPFGAKMLDSGQIVLVEGYDGREHAPSQALIDLLENALREAASGLDMKACAIVYDSRVTLPGGQEKSDAIVVALDHRADYSVEVFFPYTLKDEAVALGDAFSNVGRNRVFPCSSS